MNAANGSYAFGTTGFGPFNFTTSGTLNYFIAVAPPAPAMVLHANPPPSPRRSAQRQAWGPSISS
ncbi:MAG: hypothetical protein HPM95_10780 [Alphaproteobacteria bacterium]|nr:hypothetical protein [Alphaproteobacteria bacterium]